jgi:hypothetical protein
MLSPILMLVAGLVAAIATCLQLKCIIAGIIETGIVNPIPCSVIAVNRMGVLTNIRLLPRKWQ